MASSPKPRAIVVGAGIGGISTAARLAHAGFSVEVYEKNDFSGGRCSLIHHKGYRFDQGPSLLLLPPLFRQLYEDLGEVMEAHVELLQCRPNYVVHYHDGEKVLLSSDRAQMGMEADKWDGPGGAGRLEAFLAEARRHAELSYTLVLSQTFPSLLSLLRPSFLLNVITLHPFGSLWGRCSRYFKTERMRRAFSFGSMYLGSSPFDSPGTYSLLQWTETCEGIWYPIGGFHRVPASIQRIAESHGAKFHFSTPVRRVTYARDAKGKRKATGVELENGEMKSADVVVVNADLVWAYNNLFSEAGGVLGEDVKTRANGHLASNGHGVTNGNVHGGTKGEEKLLDPRRAKRLLDKPHSCSSISFYWALDRRLPQLNAHNIFLAEEYKASFDDIFRHHSMPREPSFYVNVPSRIDTSAAPEGKDAVVVLVPVGHLLPEGGSMEAESGVRVGGKKSQDWDELVERARTQVVEIMEKRLGIEGLRKMIVWEGVNTPLTWKDKFNLTHGSILGITHDFFNVLCFRHQARHPSVRGAYFVGASAHPGTGVPIAIAGSKLCAEAILDDCGLAYPACYSVGSATGGVRRDGRGSAQVMGWGGGGQALDTRVGRKWVYVLEELVWVGAPYVVGAVVGMVLLGLILLAMGVCEVQVGPLRAVEATRRWWVTTKAEL